VKLGNASEEVLLIAAAGLACVMVYPNI
jgi:hypothetical protein